MRVEDNDLCVKGLSVLIANLGNVEAERFVSLMNQGAGDYTEWRRTYLFEGETVRSLAEKARQTGDKLRSVHSVRA